MNADEQKIEIEAQAIIETLKEQRNSALDQVVMLNAALNALKKKVAELENPAASPRPSASVKRLHDDKHEESAAD